MNFTPTLLRWWFRMTGRHHLLRLYNGILGSGKPGAAMLPSELIDQALELLLSGIGNTLFIHSNRQWIWPFWIEQQQNPNCKDFIPTGVNVVTTNLSHRNWTTVGCYHSSQEAMIDPVGMMSTAPFSWSIFPYLKENNILHVPPQMADRCKQSLTQDEPCGVLTEYQIGKHVSWSILARPVIHAEEEWLEWTVSIHNTSDRDQELLMGMSIRPYNMLTMGPIHHLSYLKRQWFIHQDSAVEIDWDPSQLRLSDRQQGDPILNEGNTGSTVMTSRSGLLAGTMEDRICLHKGESKSWTGRAKIGPCGQAKRLSNEDPSKENALQIHWPKKFLAEVFDGVAKRFHVFDDISHYTPGSFFYHRHWIRDSAFLMMADLNLGRYSNIVIKIETWMKSQDRRGMFNSQKGEWDSTGQVLFMIGKVVKRIPEAKLVQCHFFKLRKAALWIINMRQSAEGGKGLHQGLLPSGISAEHFGPNDHYFWDNFWSLAGLKSWLLMANHLLSSKEVLWWEKEIQAYQIDLDKAMALAMGKSSGGLLPCAPTRRFDSATIGNLVAIHPLALFSEQCNWVESTIEHLLQHQVRKGLFYQDIIHTGYNPYLTLQLSTVLMMRGDRRYLEHFKAVCAIGGPTFTWPEAIHPFTGGGCMGDGDHGWVLAEVINLMRDMLVVERDHEIHLGQGLCEEWFNKGRNLKVENAAIDGGHISYRLEKNEGGWLWTWKLQAKNQNIMLLEPLSQDSKKRQKKLVTAPEGTLQWSNESELAQYTV